MWSIRMEYFALVVFIYVLVDTLVSKETGFLGSIVKKNENPLTFYVDVGIIIFAIIFDILYIFDNV